MDFFSCRAAGQDCQERRADHVNQVHGTLQKWVSRADGSVTLSLPQWAPETEARRFAESQEGWIRKTLAARPHYRALAVGDRLPFEGMLYQIEAAPLRTVRLLDDRMLVPQSAQSRPGPMIETFVKLAARQRLQLASDRYAAQLGRAHAGLTLRDTKSRWGSCSAAGRLMFSWRLILAPPDVLTYVAAHEVAHLAEMNHAPAFWAAVARLMPDYHRHRNWLRLNGAALQAIRFRDCRSLVRAVT